MMKDDEKRMKVEERERESKPISVVCRNLFKEPDKL